MAGAVLAGWCKSPNGRVLGQLTYAAGSGFSHEASQARFCLLQHVDMLQGHCQGCPESFTTVQKRKSHGA